MSKITQEAFELEAIKSILMQSPYGMPISTLQSKLDFSGDERTLRRRLDKLVSKGEIEKSGKTKGVIYSCYEEQHISQGDYVEEDAPVAEIQLTQKSKMLVSMLDRPQETRKAVGYNRGFLDTYQPNITSYLTEREKIKLATLGKTARQNEPAGTYAKDILQRLLIDLSWNSSRLEGNTYSLLDTERLISMGKMADNKSQRDAQMILNHKEAIEFIVTNSSEIGFNRYTILNLHALLSNNLLPDPAAPGRLRRFGVGIHQSVYTPPVIPQFIEEMFNLILEKANNINDPFEQAFFMMVHLPYLQPFEDVNKRVSRLAANISLNKKNLVPVSFVDVPGPLYTKGILGVYELNNTELLKNVFMWAYEKSSARYSALRQSIGEPNPFRLKYKDVMRGLITEIVTKQMGFTQATALIEQSTINIDESDRAMFREMVETELLSLHEGSIARYSIRPSQFALWQENWSK